MSELNGLRNIIGDTAATVHGIEPLPVREDYATEAEYEIACEMYAHISLWRTARRSEP